MTRSATLPRFIMALLMAVAVTFGPVGVALSQVGQEVSSRLPVLAETGEFDRILTTLEESGAVESPSVANLVQDLKRYQKHATRGATKRQEAYDQATAEMARHMESDRVHDALLSAIEAHSLADDPTSLLTNSQLMALVQRAEAAADEARASGDWLEVLDIYRRLNLLYDDQATYLSPTRDAERHVRILRLYAPRALEAMLEQRAAERQRLQALEEPEDSSDQSADAAQDEGADEADQVIERIDLGDETWQQRLAGVHLVTMRKAVTDAANKHVDAGDWSPVMQGAVNALLVMINTPQIAESFPAMNDVHAVSAFRTGLINLRHQLNQRGHRLSHFDSNRMIDRISELNRQSVNFPEAVLAYEMADGALSSLDDFSTVIWPHEMEQFSRSFSGKFFGVGIQISKRDGRLIVVSPLADTPAMRAGIKAGDVIATVNDLNTDAWTLDKAVREITGPEGSIVKLGIERTGSDGLVTYEIRRAEIPIESVRGWTHRDDGTWDYFIDPVSRIGYIRLSQFIPQTADELDAAINQMERERPLAGLILDLRFNPGGLLSSAIDVSDRFLVSGPIVSTIDSTGTRTSEARARPERTHRNFPLVVLINQGSASASEIVSGALQDYGRALVVGERSFGKGSVQDLFRFEGGRVFLKLTTQYYMLPGKNGKGGRIIHRKPGSKTWGVEPDLLVKMTPQEVADSIELRQKIDVLRTSDEQADGSGDGEPIPSASDILDNGVDPQLEAALLVLKTRLVAHHLTLAHNLQENQAQSVGTP